MNVFKLLSRSSKPLHTNETKTPSSGAVLNPQLFGQEEERSVRSSNKSRKRKRGHDHVTPAPSIPPELDFFQGAPKQRIRKQSEDSKHLHRAYKRGNADESKSKGDGVDDTTIEDDEEELENEEEYKRILRSHKLKIVVLEDFSTTSVKQREGTRKQSKRKGEDNVAGSVQKSTKPHLHPRPLHSFEELKTRYKISSRLAENVAEQGYKLPTEVQIGALPLLLEDKMVASGKDNGIMRHSMGLPGYHLLAVAPTGSGKTVAFIVPIIHALLSQNDAGASLDDGPRALILAPTKELASQIVNEARKLSKGTRIKATLMKKGIEIIGKGEHRGAPEDGADEVLDSNVERDYDSECSSDPPLYAKGLSQSDRVKAAILVATPLALLNALRGKDGTTSDLPNIRHLVLDEADVLLDPLFREQTLSIWNACNSPTLQVGLWSATMGSNIESLVIETLKQRQERNSAGCAPLLRLVVGLKDSAIPNVAHKLIYAGNEQGKLLGLRQLLHPTAAISSEQEASLRPPFLVFTQTIARAIALHSELLYDIPPEAGGSSRMAVLHADLSSSARENIMTRFRRGEVWVLITTDLLARGVDFRGLNGVVNYDVPNSAASYVHRVGRTGRAGRAGGVAVTYYTQEDIPYIKNVANVIRISEKQQGKGEDCATVQQWLLDALPTPSKNEKQRLKKRGVEARRSVKDDKGRGSMRISTKSGYERRMDNNIRSARAASQRRAQVELPTRSSSESEFDSFDDE